MSNFTKVISKLPSTVPFVGPEAEERMHGSPFRCRVGANENVFGPSPLAIGAMQEAVPGCWMYGDPESHDLRMALADYHRVRPDNMVVGEGIDGLLGYLARMFVAPGTKVVTSLGAYPTFSYHVAGCGGELVTVPYKNDHEDPDGLVDSARRECAKLVYMANPDNLVNTAVLDHPSPRHALGAG